MPSWHPRVGARVTARLKNVRWKKSNDGVRSDASLYWRHCPKEDLEKVSKESIGREALIKLRMRRCIWVVVGWSDGFGKMVGEAKI